MQLRLPWDRPRVATPQPVRHVVIAGEAIELEVVRHHRARRYVLHVSAKDTLRLTVPRGASIAGGVRFAERQQAWITRERERRRAQSAAWAPGRPCWYRGEQVALDVTGETITFGAERIAIDQGSRGIDVRLLFEAHLRALATTELPMRAFELAAATGVRIARVSVRNQRSRWGACSARGVVTLNWRLIQMPASVSDYIVFHELMHVRQPNHSRRFWREVEKVCPWWRDAEHWIRRHGREIL